jgi:hypothetical protein
MRSEMDVNEATPRPEIDITAVRRALVDDIGQELSQALAQGDPFQIFDRIYVAKTITRVLDGVRDRIDVAEAVR